jgi:hypothetical protein
LLQPPHSPLEPSSPELLLAEVASAIHWRHPGAECNPEDSNQVFAILSVRLCLDLVLANPKSFPMAQTAVNQYMRILDSVEPENGIMYTTTPSEPILANAAMHHLYSTRTKWPLSLKTFTKDLLNHGIIEKGRKGELYTRLLLTLA